MNVVVSLLHADKVSMRVVVNNVKDNAIIGYVHSCCITCMTGTVKHITNENQREKKALKAFQLFLEVTTVYIFYRLLLSAI